MLKLNLLRNVTTLYRKLPGASGSVPILIATSPSNMANGVATIARRADTHAEIGRLFVGKHNSLMKHRGSVVVGVGKDYQGKGIGTALFSNMLNNIKRFVPSIKFLHGSIISPAQVSVRSKFKTKFVKTGYQQKPFLRRIGVAEAKEESLGSYGARAITMVNSNKRYQKPHFVRIRGRIVPIRRGSR